MRAKRAIAESGATIPYCAFNGGSDVFIDVGNKRVGVAALQKYGMLIFFDLFYY